MAQDYDNTGYSDGGSSGGPPGPPPPMAPPPPVNPTRQSITDYDTYLTGPGGLLDRFGDIESTLKARSNGIDPTFDAVKQGEFAQLQGEENAQVSAGEKMFTRNGMGDSTASLNAANRTRSSFAGQRMALGSNLDMQALQERDAALQGYGSALTTEGEIKAAPVAFGISETAAENAGRGGGSSGGGNGLCCFIFLEARYGTGTMDKVVRRYRDEHMTERNRRGYYKLSEVLVPLMRRYRGVKLLVRLTLTDPLVAYGKWHYGQSRLGWIFKPVARWWLELFDYLGGDHPFIRENGEVV